MPPSARTVLEGFPPVQAQLLYSRGLPSPAQARAFLSFDPVSHDPFALPDMEAAVGRMRQALQKREGIGVFGDFDVDGLSATALLATALRPLGCLIVPYIPHRVDEGHGLSMQAVERLAAQDVRLLITVDCGISSHKEIAYAAGMGIDTIVTDHHLPPQQTPLALAVVDPRLHGSSYPFAELTGAGLALKLAQGLYSAMSFPTAHLLPPLFPLAALGTIADVAPLVDENRSIVRQGLAHMSRTPSVGLNALVRSARLEGRALDTESVGWQLAPRLNASGRIDSADLSYRLLVTQSSQEAAALAQSLEQQNRQRQEMTEEAYRKAKSILEPGPLLMVGDPSFSPGIIGLVAGRLAEEFARPSVVISQGVETSRGSCRSVPWFDIGRALYQIEEAVGGFVRHGGHAQAAGFTVETQRLPVLRQALTRLAAERLRQTSNGNQDEALPAPWLDVDMETPLGTLPRDVYRQVQSLAPFGPGNPEPVFLSRAVQVLEARPMGAGGKHLRLKLKDGGIAWNAVAFGQGDRLPAGATRLDIAYAVEMDHWGGQERLQLRVLDFRVVG
ncbi:MAG: single-stranded-DNA-specific exonuclease RecJ [Chloroflexi bacterium]|nr:single-stranded-DNA-specific exonuclease RecJ [Chloroflexota bacterium]